MMTGLSWDAASFQSYSAFFGVGFTTREAELVCKSSGPPKNHSRSDFHWKYRFDSGLATLIATLMQNSSGIQPMIVLWGSLRD